MSDLWVLWRKLTCDEGHYWIEPREQPGRLSKTRRCPACQSPAANDQQVLVSLRNKE